MIREYDKRDSISALVDQRKSPSRAHGLLPRQQVKLSMREPDVLRGPPLLLNIFDFGGCHCTFALERREPDSWRTTAATVVTGRGAHLQQCRQQQLKRQTSKRNGQCLDGFECLVISRRLKTERRVQSAMQTRRQSRAPARVSSKTC